MRIEREVINNIVLSAVEQANAMRPPESQLTTSGATLLTADGGNLNSLELITFLLDVEERIKETLSAEVTLFDESLIADPEGPFRTLGTLVDHLHSTVRKA